MNLFFIYDTSVCNPDDDPSKAMVYFYPLQELESEHFTLYYQIIGIAQFLQATFSSPSTVTLDNSSFVVCRSKHYLLVLGGSKESTELLKTQLKLMCKVFAFYHSSIAEVFHIVNKDRQLFKRKMNKIWTRCLSVVLHYQDRMQLSCHSLPVIVFPQDHDMKTVALLNMCKAELEVLAGAVFYHETLLYTQFLPDVTSALSLLTTQNVLGFNVPMKYKFPPGVKLKYVYLTKTEMAHLQKRRCKRFPKGKRKRFRSFYSNSGSEGDVESDCRNHEFIHDPEPNEALQTFRLNLSDHYQKGFYRMYCSANLPCSSHQIKVPFPGIKTALHQSKKECCDLEFQCLLCKGGSECLVLSKPYFLSVMKRWNSETDIMCFHNQQRTMSEVFPSKHLKKRYSKIGDKQKRLKTFGKRNSKPSSVSSQDTDSIGRLSSQKSDSSQWSDFFYLPYSKTLRSEEEARCCNSPLLSSDELHQECVLYIQRYGDSSLMLLLSSVPSVNILVYLWHCGFTFLPSIAYNAYKKFNNKHRLPDDRSDFSIYTYKYHSNVLDGKLPPNRGVSSNDVKATIHEDFYSDPLLYSISIMDPNRSICAYNTKEKQIFYEQFGKMHRKLNWFSQFWERASRRTEKYLNITLPKF